MICEVTHHTKYREKEQEVQLTMPGQKKLDLLVLERKGKKGIFLMTS